MYLEKLSFTEKDIKDYENKSAMCNFRSKFNFFKSHRGVRENKMHLLISPTGAGKSTFVRSIICDMVFQNKDKKILLWLTEESIDDFRQEFSATVPVHEILENITMISEKGTNPTETEVQQAIEDAVSIVEPDIIICDNITTSKLYMDKQVSRQSEVAMWLKDFTKDTAVFIIAHSNGNGYEDKFLNENDIRGSKSITNLVEFLYILQPVRVGDRLYQFINIIKHRGQSISCKFFRLHYDYDLKSFGHDAPTDFSKIKEIFKQRNTLNGK